MFLPINRNCGGCSQILKQFPGGALANDARRRIFLTDNQAGRAAPIEGPSFNACLATFADGVADMEVMDAIRLSSAERRWVNLS